MNVHAFISKWAKTELKERSASQEHFIDLCRLLGHPTPAEMDPSGNSFCFERGAKKVGGGDGWADVWKKAFFAWEYKGKHNHKTLVDAYAQLNRYRESLENPPLLVVCDIARFEIHTSFTGTVTEIYQFSNEDLGKQENLDVLRSLFHDPEKLRPARTLAKVTEEAAEEFCKLADRLRGRKVDPHQASHFLMKIVFCMFAEDVGLLPKGIFAKIVEKTRENPTEFTKYAADLFEAMAQGGKSFLLERIHHFNGGLFADANVIPLKSEELELLGKVAELDWSYIEPAIFGTLFERSLDPGKRTQLGAHYTSRADIETVVEPVLMAPLRREWDATRARAEKFREQMERKTGAEYKKTRKQFEREISQFLTKLQTVKVLDPACGSGNFLYIALKLLKDLEKEVITYAETAAGGTLGLIPLVQPEQLYGIEYNAYAQELASVVVWIGHIQWHRDNGFVVNTNPVLRPLNNVVQADALIETSAGARTKERDWIKLLSHGKKRLEETLHFDAIVGNPPFLGGKMLRRDLGDEYVDSLFAVFEKSVAREADYVCYWFEKACDLIRRRRASRAGLLGTQGIRGGANRKVLERIKSSGDIFFAVSDREWMLDGAAVNISIVGFDDGTEKHRTLDGAPVKTINPDLTTGTNVAEAAALRSNVGLSFMGDTKGGAFDIPGELAKKFLAARNPNGKPNSDVLQRWVNGLDVLRRPRGMWIIDFGVERPESEAAQYEGPFEHVKRLVYPERSKNKRETYRKLWWIHVEPRPAMRKALARQKRFIATPTVSKHRIFVWLEPRVLPDHQLIAFALDSDYAFGVLHSRTHEVWALKQGTRLQTRPRYTPDTTFETFPFPWPLGKEPGPGQSRYELVRAIEEAARQLNEKREQWLGPVGDRSRVGSRTLTGLYNERPTWLGDAHSALDQAVFAAYGWKGPMTDIDLLSKLLECNQRQSTPRG